MVDNLLSFKQHGVAHYNSASQLVANLIELAEVHKDSEAGRDILSEPIQKVQYIIIFTNICYAEFLVCRSTGKD